MNNTSISHRILQIWPKWLPALKTNEIRWLILTFPIPFWSILVGIFLLVKIGFWVLIRKDTKDFSSF